MGLPPRHRMYEAAEMLSYPGNAAKRFPHQSLSVPNQKIPAKAVRHEPFPNQRHRLLHPAIQFRQLKYRGILS